MSKQKIFSEVILQNSKNVQILEGNGLQFFDALSKSQGDTGILIKHLILCLVIVDGKPITNIELDEMNMKDASYLTQVIGLMLTEDYK